MSKGFYGFATFFECGFDLTNPLLSAVLPSSLMVFLMHTGISTLTKEGKTDFSTVLEQVLERGAKLDVYCHPNPGGCLKLFHSFLGWPPFHPAFCPLDDENINGVPKSFHICTKICLQRH